MNQNRGNVWVILLIVAAIAASGAVGFWWKQKQNVGPVQPPIEEPKKNLQSPDETASWKTYESTISGYSLKYLSNWTLKDWTKQISGTESVIGLTPSNIPTTLDKLGAIVILVGTN